MERSTIIGFIITLIIALFLSAGYIVFKAAKNPTPPRTTTTTVPSTTAVKPPTQSASTTQPKTPPLKVPAPEFREPISEPDCKIKMLREVKGGGGAKPESTIDITVILEKEGTKTVRALGIQELLPTGWAFDSVVDGTKPDLAPPKGRTPLLEFAWFNIPSFPTSFTYRVRVPKEFKEPGEIQGQTLYRADGGEMRTEIVKSPVVPSDTATPQSADTSPSGKSEEMQPDATQEKPAKSQATTTTPAEKQATESMTLTREIKPAKYTPNSKLEITDTINFSGPSPVTAMALVEMLPPQFEFERITSNSAPPIIPKKGDTGTLQFVWVAVPEFPTTLSYEVNVKADSTGDKTITGQVIYHTDGPQKQSERVITNIPQETK
ncbi:MAG TPA: hypothetical protein PLT82_06810 [Candidatus Hydrogenedens sp.]|nr:hypothetical protein [Candidatus Hydrogenedens sp.]HOL20536.1 hypothetical protein [Candidatus Hydrogenedens sp.]HPP58828.1 hypothetical protein [Candidatus Hydrogenedens sp.]